jgi:hypothetical protein
MLRLPPVTSSRHKIDNEIVNNIKMRNGIQWSLTQPIEDLNFEDNLAALFDNPVQIQEITIGPQRIHTAAISSSSLQQSACTKT